MPTFCRHNRLVQNCSICAREQDVELRPLVTPQGRPEPRPAAAPRSAPASRPGRPAGSTTARRPSGGRGGGMTVRRLQRAADDGYACDLVPGVRSAADAERLAEETAFAATRLRVLGADPPGLYAAVAAVDSDVDERLWLAWQIAFCSPLDEDDPFAGIEAIRRSWVSGETPAFGDGPLGPRAGGDAARGERTSVAYRAWAARSHGQLAGLAGDPGWTPERRFDRAFERLGTVASMERGPRYDLLVGLGRLGVLEMEAASLQLGGADPVTLAAKRLLGIGDPLLLQRRAAELADACGLPIAALDLGFFSWERGTRYSGGLPRSTEPDEELLAGARAALGL